MLFKQVYITSLNQKERFYENHAKSLDSDKILIVCDRGSLDAEAYLSPEDKERWLEELGLTETMIDYDAVFHLVTAAKGQNSLCMEQS